MRRAAALCALSVVVPAVARAQADCEAPPVTDRVLGDDGRWHRASTAFAHFGARSRRPNYWLPAIESVASLSIGTIWYWVDKDRNVFDWDRPSLKERLSLEAWRFDNNQFPINFAAHPLSGSGWYALARGARFSVAGAFAYSFGTSFLWEYVIEFNEKVSINDVFLTPAAGLAIGEFAHRLGQYLNSAPGGGLRVHRAARWTFGAAVAIPNAVDRIPYALPTAPKDELGFSRDFWHRFRLTLDATWHRVIDGEEFLTAGATLDGRIVAMPGYRRPGTFRLFFREGNFTSLRLAAAGYHGAGWDLTARTILLGAYRQDFSGTLDRVYGHASLVGLGVGYRYRFEDFDEWKDRTGVFEFPGPVLSFDWMVGSAELHLSAGASIDFAGMHSFAFGEWQAAHPDARGKTPLSNHGYWFGWGGSTHIDFELEMRRIELGGTFTFGFYDSIEGLDRAQSEVTVDANGTDQVLDYRAWILMRPERRGFFFELATRGTRRVSHLGDQRRAKRVHAVIVSAGWSF